MILSIVIVWHLRTLCREWEFLIQDAENNKLIVEVWEEMVFSWECLMANKSMHKNKSALKKRTSMILWLPLWSFTMCGRLPLYVDKAIMKDKDRKTRNYRQLEYPHSFPVLKPSKLQTILSELLFVGITGFSMTSWGMIKPFDSLKSDSIQWVLLKKLVWIGLIVLQIFPQ